MRPFMERDYNKRSVLALPLLCGPALTIPEDCAPQRVEVGTSRGLPDSLGSSILKPLVRNRESFFLL